MIDVHRAPLYNNDQCDRCLMQTLLEHSSSHLSRDAAATWVADFDAALARGAPVSRAQILADAAYRATATMIGLPTGDRRSQ